MTAELEQRVQRLEAGMETLQATMQLIAQQQLVVTQQQLANVQAIGQLGQRVDQIGSQVSEFASQAQQLQLETQRQIDTLAANQVNERDQRSSLREDIELLYRTVQQQGQNFDATVTEMGVGIQRLTQQVTQLTSDIGGLALQMEEQGQRAEQDRSQAAIDRADFRSTVERLLQVLTQQFSGNGHGE